MKQRYILVLFITAVVLLSTSLGAHATSYYDGKILTTDKLEVLSVEGTTDLTTDWRRVFLGILERKTGDSDSDTMLSQFSANQSVGAGWLVQSSNQGMRVITFDPDATITFDNDWYGYLYLEFSQGEVCVWEANGYSHRDWRNLDAEPGLKSHSSTVCGSFDSIGPPYVQYDVGLTGPAFLKPYLFIASDNIQYPPGYEGDLIPENEPGAQYVAMGDSFSSGEGNSPFESGTDIGGDYENRCHRSSQAYPRLLQNDSTLDIESMAFVACSGATTSNVVDSGQWSEPTQVDALSMDTEIVTITIGGNDIGFGSYVEACTLTSCGPGWPAFDDIMDSIDSTDFLDDLKDVYEEVLTKAPNADVYVVGYPYVIDSENNHIHCILYDRSGATLVTDNLNTTIGLAVAQVRSQSTDFNDRLKYVSATSSNSPFDGKQLCAVPQEEAWFNTTVLAIEHSLHPNGMGHHGYYELVKGALQ